MSASDHLNGDQHYYNFSAGDKTPWGRIGSNDFWGPRDSPEGRAHSKAVDDEWNRQQQQEELFLKRRMQMHNPSNEYEEEPGDYYEHQTSWDNRD